MFVPLTPILFLKPMNFFELRFLHNVSNPSRYFFQISVFPDQHKITTLSLSLTHTDYTLRRKARKRKIFNDTIILLVLIIFIQYILLYQGFIPFHT